MSCKTDRKDLITIRIKKSLILKLKEIKGYNILIEHILEDYFKNNPND